MIAAKMTRKGWIILRKLRQMRASGQITQTDSRMVNGIPVDLQKAANSLGYKAKLAGY